MKAFEKYLDEVDSVFKEGMDFYNTAQEKDFITDAYAVCKSISIDYGVMEKADNVYVLASDFGWSDLGTWGSLYEHLHKDERGNAITGKNVIAYDMSNCIVKMPAEKLVVLQGLDDYIVIEDENILLICKKTDEQKIKQFVSDVKEKKGEKNL
jgi:mannose-1-phosphate guanylyltransferase